MKAEYWKQRCELAESLIGQSDLWQGYDKAYNEWQRLKTQPIPPTQIDIETLREKLLSMRYTTKEMHSIGKGYAYNHALGYHDCINDLLIWTKKIKDKSK